LTVPSGSFAHQQAVAGSGVGMMGAEDEVDPRWAPPGQAAIGDPTSCIGEDDHGVVAAMGAGFALRLRERQGLVARLGLLGIARQQEACLDDRVILVGAADQPGWRFSQSVVTSSSAVASRRSPGVRSGRLVLERRPLPNDITTRGDWPGRRVIGIVWTSSESRPVEATKTLGLAPASMHLTSCEEDSAASSLEPREALGVLALRVPNRTSRTV
jgi:hypothetical protein